jgi:hypothetical protein
LSCNILLRDLLLAKILLRLEALLDGRIGWLQLDTYRWLRKAGEE